MYARLQDGRVLTLEVEGHDTVEVVCAKIAEQHPEAHPALQTLGLDGRALDASRPIADYGVAMETTFTVAVRREEQEIVLNVGGTRFSTLLSTLLTQPGTRIHEMFAPLLHGGVPSFPGASERERADVGGLPEGVPHRHRAAGPLPRGKDGAYLIDRNGIMFDYILDYLRDGAVVLPPSAIEQQQLITEARYYGLVELAHACGCPLAGLAATCETGVTVAEILGLSDAERQTLCVEQRLSVVARKRVEVEIELRRVLGAVLSKPGLCALVAAGQTLRTVWHLDRAAATRMGLSERDAQTVVEGEAGLELRLQLAENYVGPMRLSEAAVHALVAAQLAVADVRKLDGAAARQLGIAEEDVRKILWEGEAGLALRNGLGCVGLSEAGLSSLVIAGLTVCDVRGLDEAAAQALGLAEDDARKLVEELAVCLFEHLDNSVVGNGKFDERGVIHHIATEGGLSDWVNPHNAGRVQVEWSSIQHGPVENFVSKYDARPPQWSRTEGRATNEWMRVDLKRQVVVNHYALRHEGSDNYALRNWELQGGDAANGPWTTLRRHENDLTIETKRGFVAAWPVADADRPFRFFRILQYGGNAAGFHHLICAGFELYGTIFNQ